MMMIAAAARVTTPFNWTPFLSAITGAVVGGGIAGFASIRAARASAERQAQLAGDVALRVFRIQQEGAALQELLAVIFRVRERITNELAHRTNPGNWKLPDELTNVVEAWKNAATKVRADNVFLAWDKAQIGDLRTRWRTRSETTVTEETRTAVAEIMDALGAVEIAARAALDRRVEGE